MIILPFKFIKVGFDFSFFAAVSLVILLNDNNYALYALFACLLHEFGHLIAMKITGQKIDSLIFYGAGIKILKQKCCQISGFINDAFVLSAGCFVNFLIFLFCMVFKSDNTLLFGYINLIIGLFNMLPIHSLDGGALILLFINRFYKSGTAINYEKYLKELNIFLCISLMAVFFIIRCTNITLYASVIYIIIMTMAL